MKHKLTADRIAVCFLSALCAFLFWKVLFAGPRLIIGGMDMIDMFYNWKSFIKEAYLSGNLPLWNPYVYCGHPFASNSDAAAFYPPDVIFLALPVERAINISLFLHIFLAGVFMFCWVRHFESTAPSLVAAMAFMLCGFFMARITPGHLSMIRTGAYLPLLFCLYEHAVRSRKRTWVIFGGFAFGMQLLAGHPQIAYYSIMFLGLYALCRYLCDMRAKNAWRFLLVFFLIALLGAATAAVTLLPMLEMSALSVRTDTNFDYVSMMSMNPLQLIHLLFPEVTFAWPGVLGLPVNWEWSLYLGILSVFLALAGVVSRKRHAALFVFLALSALIVAFGKYTPLFKAMYHIVPGFKLFRIHSRSMLVFIFFCATLAGMGAGALLELNERRQASMKKWLPLAWSFIALAAISLVVLTSHNRFEVILQPRFDVLPLSLFDRPLLIPLAFIVIAVVIGWLVYLKKIPTRYLELFLISVLACDLLLAGWGHIKLFRIPEHPDMSQLSDDTGGSQGRFRVFLPDSVLSPNHSMVHHIENINGMSPLALKRTMRFLSAACGVPSFRFPTDYKVDPECFQNKHPFPLRILNVLYSMSYDSLSKLRLLRDPNPFPRALWIGHAETLTEPEAVLNRVLAEDFDPYRTVLLEKQPKEPPASHDGSIPWVPAQISDYQINRITVAVNAPENGWLLLSEQFYPGWKASCDGEPVTVYRADYLLRAVPVTAGQHTVVLRYSPASFKIGAIASVASMLLFVGAVICHLRSAKDNPLWAMRR